MDVREAAFQQPSAFFCEKINVALETMFKMEEGEEVIFWLHSKDVCEYTDVLLWSLSVQYCLRSATGDSQAHLSQSL